MRCELLARDDSGRAPDRLYQPDLPRRDLDPRRNQQHRHIHRALHHRSHRTRQHRLRPVVHRLVPGQHRARRRCSGRARRLRLRVEPDEALDPRSRTRAVAGCDVVVVVQLNSGFCIDDSRRGRGWSMAMRALPFLVPTSRLVGEGHAILRNSVRGCQVAIANRGERSAEPGNRTVVRHHREGDVGAAITRRGRWDGRRFDSGACGRVSGGTGVARACATRRG